MSERFEISMPVRLEWDDEETGKHIVEEGRTENVGLHGTLVHLPRNLPRVGSKIKLAVFEAKGAEVISVPVRVLRIERNPSHPLAALRLIESPEAWHKSVFHNKDLIDSFTESAEGYED